jgi:sulfite dehydrogenase (quinone) subunit SoeC
MNPAFSVIVFTSASGAGYGLLFVLGLDCLRAPGNLSGAESLTVLGLGLLLVSIGLLSSLLHLGKPQRAWRALSQWRTSWLSREGAVALATYLPAALLGLCLLRGSGGIACRAFGLLLAVGAVATVFCTARIYTSLKTIHAWNNGYVLPGYLLLALLTGVFWWWAIRAAFGHDLSGRWLIVFAVLALAARQCKVGYWKFLAASAHPATPESATGLGALGKVSSFERPHTEENYLLREMGFMVGRQHADKLRALCLHLAFHLPLALLLIALIFWNNVFIAALAALSASIGVILERWLFFAEAKHVVTLYYGAQRA